MVSREDFFLPKSVRRPMNDEPPFIKSFSKRMIWFLMLGPMSVKEPRHCSE